MQDRLSWAQAACARVFRPLIRLAVAMGLKYPHLEEMLRSLLLAEAHRLWQVKGIANPNISQLAVTTGLNRKEVTARVRSPADPLPHTELSAAAKTFTLWFQLASQDPAHGRIPVVGSTGELSFEAVARRASRGDVHHRSVLDELVRLGMVMESDGQVELRADGFVPSGDLQATLAFLGDNVRDHLAAAVSNTLGEAPLLLERAVFADGLTLADCETIQTLARQRWVGLHREFVSVMTDAVEQAQGNGTKRIRVGIYVFHDDVAETGEASAPAVPRGS